MKLLLSILILLSIVGCKENEKDEFAIEPKEQIDSLISGTTWDIDSTSCRCDTIWTKDSTRIIIKY